MLMLYRLGKCKLTVSNDSTRSSKLKSLEDRGASQELGVLSQELRFSRRETKDFHVINFSCNLLEKDGRDPL